MSHRRRARGRFVRAGALLSVAALLATACGGGGGSGAASDCGKTLKLGLLTDFTGELGSFGKGSKQGFELAVKQMKSSGKLPSGWKVDTVVNDEKTDVQEGVRAATTMIKNEEVSAIIGPSSGPIVGMVKLAERSQTPIISHFAGTVNLDRLGGEWIYRTVASDSADGEAAAQWLRDKNEDSVVLLVQNDQSTVSIAKALQKAYESGGGKVAKVIKYNAGQPSYQSVVQQATSAKADGIFLAGGQESGITILKELRNNGYPSDQVVLSADMAVPTVVKQVGGAGWANGMQAESAQSDTSRAPYKAFAKAYKQEYGSEPGLFVSNIYDATMLVGLAAVAAGSTCGSAINEELRDVAGPGGTKVSAFTDAASALSKDKDIDYDGASGPVDFDKSGTVAGSYAILEVKHGKWTQEKFYPATTFSGSGG
ncbi:MAG: ABC transporter substrate-binding protein [Streptosporangiales bacterium]